MLLGVRDRLISARTQLTNAIRGHAAEFGLTAAKGLAHVQPLLARIAADNRLPVLARELFALQADELARLEQEIATVEARHKEMHRADECSRRLAEIPGVGPVAASLFRLKTPAPELFGSGRDFAAWIGLTPKDHSTGGKTRLGVITKAATRPCEPLWSQAPPRSSSMPGQDEANPPRPGSRRWSRESRPSSLP